MKWEVILVPGELPASDRGSTVNVFAAKVEPRVCNTLVRQLSQAAPLEKLRHVKRVQKGVIYVAWIRVRYQYPVRVWVRGTPILKKLINYRRMIIHGRRNINYRRMIIHGRRKQRKGSDIYTVFWCTLNLCYHNHHYEVKLCAGQRPEIQLVPQYAASTKEEWEEQFKLWPTSYHPSKEGKDGACGFSDKDVEVICSFMEHAIMVAKSGSCDNQVVNAVVIVNPLVRQVISSACDQARSWPSLEHTDQCKTVPEEQFSVSADATDSKTKLRVSESTCQSLWSVCVSCLDPWGWSQQQSCSSWHPLRHASLVAIELAAARDIHLFPGGQNAIDDDEVSANLTTKRKKRDPYCGDRCIRGDDQAALDINGYSLSPSETDGVTRPYLCTGFDAYLVWEPRSMCAMALLHQRLNRIFFAFSNPKAGALGGVHRLHGEKSLNLTMRFSRFWFPTKYLQTSPLFMKHNLI